MNIHTPTHSPALLVSLAVATSLLGSCIFANDPGSADTDSPLTDTSSPADTSEVGPMDAARDTSPDGGDTPQDAARYASSDGGDAQLDAAPDLGSDGSTDTADTGATCEDGESRTCGSGIGACMFGEQTCTDGEWGDCRGGVGPSDETCDGTDEDCDGAIDEDAGCECVDGQNRECGNGTGVCTKGEQTCEEGTWSDCSGGTDGSSEVCDGRDNDCDGNTDEGLMQTYYHDGDSDGYGDPNDTTESCDGAPDGHVENANDCNDSNSEVKPSQTSYFSTGYGPSGDNFDYNCDNTEENEYTALASSCTNTCSLTAEGWVGRTTPPACGDMGQWASGCAQVVNDDCSEITQNRTQKCR